MAIDYETVVFIEDCREASKDGKLPKDEMIAIFWRTATDLREKLLKANKGHLLKPENFASDILAGMVATLARQGITVVM